ncbi:hypothetical protein [Streptomyces ramulosus]|uniref:hypothetical protein n=1 Tax=Streptomyces TaxID=1883 RepID=UPI0031E7D00C
MTEIGGRWPRALERTRALYAWYTDVHQPAVATPGHVRLWEFTTLAIAIWRTAENTDTSVDDVRLTAVTALCKRAGDRLLDPPLPALSPGRDGEIPPSHRAAQAVQAAGSIALACAGGSPGAPGGALATDAVGYVARALRADPSVPGDRGGWRPALSTAEHVLTQLRDDWTSGHWRPSAADRDAIRATGLLDPETYDYPSDPPPGELGAPSWLQQASRLAALAGTLRAASDATADPLALVLQTHAELCAALAVPAAEVEELWATADAPAGWAAWEDAHVPDMLVQQTLETVIAIRRFAAGLGSVTAGPAD